MLKTLPLICLALCLLGCSSEPPPITSVPTDLVIEVASEHPAIYLAVAQIDGVPTDYAYQNIQIFQDSKEIISSFASRDIERFVRDSGEIKCWIFNFEGTDSLFLMSEKTRPEGELFIYASVGKNNASHTAYMEWQEKPRTIYWESIQDTVWVYSQWKDYSGYY
jgi:hypothetical protein